MMRALPVRSWVVTNLTINAGAFRPFVAGLTVVAFIHWFNAFSSLAVRYAAGFASCGIFADIVSIAALYSPRRAAWLHRAR